mgnify:CR=1 FL=1
MRIDRGHHRRDATKPAAGVRLGVGLAVSFALHALVALGAGLWLRSDGASPTAMATIEVAFAMSPVSGTPGRTPSDAQTAATRSAVASAPSPPEAAPSAAGMTAASRAADAPAAGVAQAAQTAARPALSNGAAAANDARPTTAATSAVKTTFARAPAPSEPSPPMPPRRPAALVREAAPITAASAGPEPQARRPRAAAASAAAPGIPGSAAAIVASSSATASADASAPTRNVPSTAPAVAGGALANPPPEYPFLARRRGLEGVVLLRISVSAEGRATAVAVRRSSGHAILDEAAAAAVGGWRFRPATVDGKPAAGVLEAPIAFRLR